MTVRKTVKVELRKDNKLQKMLQMIAAAMAEGEIMAPDSGGEGTTPEHDSANLQWPLLNHAATEVKYRRCKDRLQNSRLGWPKKRAR